MATRCESYVKATWYILTNQTRYNILNQQEKNKVEEKTHLREILLSKHVGNLGGNCCKFEELQILISTNKLTRTYSINSYDWFEGERHTHQFSANRTVVDKLLFNYAPWESCFICSSNKVVFCAGLHSRKITFFIFPLMWPCRQMQIISRSDMVLS